MKKVLLLMAMAAFVFACGNCGSKESEGCETAKTECAEEGRNAARWAAAGIWLR